MFKDSFLFELRYRLRSAATWLCFLGLLVMAYREMLAGEWDLLIQSGRVARNSPYTVYYLFMYYTFWAATVGSALMIPTLLRDLKSGTAELVCSLPINSKSYFCGKYCASLVIFVLIMSSVVVGFVSMPYLTSALGTHSPSDFVATPWRHIGHAFLLWVLPACFIYGSLTFALTAISGRAGPAYGLMMLAVALFVMITSIYGDGAPKSSWLQVLDPLGKVTVEGQIYYWTATERMTKFLSLEGQLLYNRLLYMGLATLALLYAWWQFDLRKLLQKAKNRQLKRTAASKAHNHTELTSQNTGPQRQYSPLALAPLSRCYWLRYGLHAGCGQFLLVLKNKAFSFAMLTLILMLVMGGFSYETSHFEGGGALLPKAQILLPSLIYPSLIFTMIAAAFFSVELCHREKTYHIAPLLEVCPTPTWSLVLAKLTAVALMAFSLALIPVISLVIIQWLQGHFATNWGLLAHVSLLVLLPLMLAYGLISVICYALLPHKGLAQAVSIILCISPAILEEVKTVENFMYLWAWPFFLQLSDFAASAQYLQRNISFSVYWLSLYAALTVLAYWFWPRGQCSSLKAKWQQATDRFGPISLILACLFLGLFSASMQYIYQGMIVRNQYQSSAEKFAQQADYEKQYGATRAQPQPKIISANLQVALYPTQRRADYSAILQLQNNSSAAIAELVLHYQDFTRLRQVIYNQQGLPATAKDPIHHRLVYPLPTPLQPGEQAQLELQLAVAYQGFSNSGLDYHGTLVADGSLLTSALWPTFGYNKKQELTSAGLRKRYGLNEQSPTAAIAEIAHVTDLINGDDGDLVTSQVTITTDAKQIALAAGKLIGQQRQNGRHTYQYELDTPIPWQPTMLSADYDKAQDSWLPPDGGSAVTIEVYHHPQHKDNLTQIIAAAKQALLSGHQQWGAFPYATLRVAEAPNGMTTTLVSGNLLIIPEQQVWLHDYRHPPKTDWITFQLARDISRIWWQQVAIADVQGHPLLQEGIPVLQGLKAIAASAGESAVAALVDQITDNYLRQRTAEETQEASVLALDQQAYAKAKATLALYAAYRSLGPELFDPVLQGYYRQQLHQQRPPYANAGTLVNQLTQAVTDDKQKQFVAELFTRSG